jgi:hypothetical protein
VTRLLYFSARCSEEFQLGGSVEQSPAAITMGLRSAREMFGHNGSNHCISWADLAYDLVFFYPASMMVLATEAVRHQCAVSDAVLAACR